MKKQRKNKRNGVDKMTAEGGKVKIPGPVGREALRESSCFGANITREMLLPVAD